MSSSKDKFSLFNQDLPLERARTIPSLWYHDAEIYAAERKHVFLNSWQWVGRVEQVAEPGHFFTTEIAGEPLVITRDAHGSLRAFSNVCRHRAARVTTENCGKATHFQCRYHGWTYDLSGRLKGTPEFTGVEDFYKEENGLPTWKVDTWGKFVFVNAHPSPPPLGEFLFPLPLRVPAASIENFQFTERKEYELECNWKVYADNYLDGGYHVNSVHPRLAGIIDYANYRTEVARNTSVQVTPLKDSGVNGDRVLQETRGGQNAYYWWIYPNFMVNLYEGMMDLSVVLPLAPNKCKVIFEFFFPRPQDDLQTSRIAESLAIAHQIQLEDVTICEEVQRNLMSRSFSTGRFSVRREAGGHHFHQLLARDLQVSN